MSKIYYGNTILTIIQLKPSLMRRPVTWSNLSDPGKFNSQFSFKHANLF
jgi:hypothetical protein